MRPGPIPALLCALALLAGCAPAPAPAPTPTFSPPPPAETPAPPLPTETPGPQPLRVPEGLDGYALAYAEAIAEAEAETPGLKYDLIYLDEDAVPELAAGTQSAACLLAQLQAVAQKEAWGLEGQLPYYIYRDEDQNLQLELYFDPDAGTGRGFRYQWEDVDLGVPPSCDSFTLDSVEEGTWERRSPYSVLSVDGDDGSDMVQDYQEAWEYNEAGRPVRFRSWGIFDPGPIDTADIIRVEFDYRDDGTLERKEYRHQSMLFGTTFSSAVVHYDREERPVYNRGYITHGHLEYYPIYGDGAEPEYCLLLDYTPVPYPTMYRFP